MTTNHPTTQDPGLRAALVPCGGCGAKTDRERCIGCLHDFGDEASAWVRGATPAHAPGKAGDREGLAEICAQAISDANITNCRADEALPVVDAILAALAPSPTGNEAPQPDSPAPAPSGAEREAVAKALGELSARATPGRWVFERMIGSDFAGVYSDDATGSVLARFNGFEWAPRSDSEADANGQFVAALVNVYRSGALATLAPAVSGSGEPDSRAGVEREAEFLIMRLREFEAEELTEDQIRAWDGHVAPSIARLADRLASISSAPTASEAASPGGDRWGCWEPITTVPIGEEVLLRGGVMLMTHQPRGRSVGVIDDLADLYRPDGSLCRTAPTEWHRLPSDTSTPPSPVETPHPKAARPVGYEALRALQDLDYIQSAPTAAHPLRIARIRAVLRAALAQSQTDTGQETGSQWLPISTAPRDGTHVLVTRPGSKPIRGWYQRDRWWMHGCGPLDGRPADLTGGFAPTLWMPLPQVPTPATSAETPDTMREGGR